MLQRSELFEVCLADTEGNMMFMVEMMSHDNVHDRRCVPTFVSIAVSHDDVHAGDDVP